MRAQPRMRLGFGGAGPMTGEEASNTQSTIRRLLSYLKPYHNRLILVALLVVIGTILNLSGPALLGRGIDNYIDNANVEGLLQTVLLMGGVYLGVAVGALIHSMIMITIGQHFVADIRSTLFRHIQSLSMAYHDQHRVGDLMSRVSNDTEAINRILTNGLIEFTTNILMLGGIMIFMFILNWQLATGAIIILPIMLFITREITRRSRSAFRGVQRYLGSLNAVMEENITGVRVVQAFAREADTIAEFQAVNRESRKAGIKADIITAALGPMFTTMSILSIALISWLGGWLALQGIVSVGGVGHLCDLYHAVLSSDARHRHGL